MFIYIYLHMHILHIYLCISYCIISMQYLPIAHDIYIYKYTHISRFSRPSTCRSRHSAPFIPLQCRCSMRSHRWIEKNLGLRYQAFLIWVWLNTMLLTVLPTWLNTSYGRPLSYPADSADSQCVINDGWFAFIVNHVHLWFIRPSGWFDIK